MFLSKFHIPIFKRLSSNPFTVNNDDLQVSIDQIFRHDDIDELKKTFLVLYKDSPDGKYIVTVRNLELFGLKSKNYNKY